MFGYVRVRRAELRVREYEYYRAAYCGLCRSMGHCTGQCSRLSLSYDMAYLVHLRLLLTDTVPALKARRCAVHPLSRRAIMEGNDQLDYCARASAILVYEKCRDDLADEGFFGRIPAFFRLLFFRHAYKRAKKHLPDLAKKVRDLLLSLREIEEMAQPSVDLPAGIFGRLLGEIAAHGLPADAVPIARTVGEKTGRFVYIADALDDLKKDAKKGNFNPVLLLFGKELTTEDKESIRVALLSCLADLEAALDLAPSGSLPEIRAVMENILYLGMPDVAKQVLNPQQEEKNNESKPL